jgi:methionyl-tRNA synthetase
MHISYDDFKKVDLRVVTVLSAERVPNSEKLLKLQVNLGDSERQIIAGIGKAYEPESLVGQQITIVANLEPRELMGLTSEGMILAAHGEATESAPGLPVVLLPQTQVPPGSTIS